MHVSTYSGESGNFEDSESEASGDLASANVDSSCMLISQGPEKSLFSGECSLENALTGYVGQIDPKTNDFLKTSTFKCSSLLQKDNKKTFECEASKYEILPRGQGTITIKNVKLKLETKGVDYREMKINMEGDENAKVTKDADSDDIKLDLSPNEEIVVETYLNQHFGVSYSDLKKVTKLNEYFPDSLKQVKLTALFNQTFDYVEVIFWNDDKSFFIFQKFASSNKPSVGFFKVIDSSSVEVLNKVLNVKPTETFLPIFKMSNSCFSSCTSDITMIMSTQHRDLTKDCITEGSNTMMSEGTTLRWRIEDPKKVKVSTDLKSNGIVEVLRDNIGLSALVSEDNGVIKTTSSDNIRSSLSNIIQTFIPTYTDIILNDPFKDVLTKTVAFKTLDIDNKNVYLQCIIDEDWFLADNLVNLKGMNLKIEGEINKEKWAISGNGDIMILGEMLEAKVEKDNKKLEYLLYADFNASSMKELTSVSQNVTFLPEEDDSKFESLKNLPLSSLQLGIKLNSKFLKFYGQTLSYASSTNKDDSQTFSQLEIVLYMKGEYPKMIVGICHDFVLFEKFTDEVLSIKLEGVPWLVFENLCYIMGKDEEKDLEIVKSFESEAFTKIKDALIIKPGIHFTGSISYEESVKNIVTNDQTTKDEIADENPPKKQDILNFIKNNLEIFNVLKYGEGTISQTTFSFEAKRSLVDSFFTLKNHDDLIIKNPSLHIKEIVKETVTVEISKNVEDSVVVKHRRKKHRSHHKKPEVRSVEDSSTIKETERVVGMILKGSFENINEDLHFVFDGEISSCDTGLLTLQCKNAVVKVLRSEAEFQISEGKSVANENVFSIFDFESQAKLIFQNRETVMKRACLSFDIGEPSQMYFSSKMKLKNFSAVLTRFQLNEQLKGMKGKFIFADSDFNERSLLVLSGKNTIVVDAGNRTARESVLTLFGSVKRNIKDTSDFKIEIKKCFMRYEEWLPMLSDTSSNFKIYHKADRSMGPKLKVEWNFCRIKNFKSIFEGEIETIGISEFFNFEVMNNGRFSLFPESKFFSEAKAAISIKQEINLLSLKDINPKLHVDLINDPETKNLIKSTVENHFKGLAKEFSDAYNGAFFSNQNIAAENLLYNSTKNVIDALEPVNKMISDQISNINSILSIANQDCVQKCSQSEVKIPGINAQDISTNEITFEWKPDYKIAANVTCIADCEMEKSLSTEGLSYNFNDVKKLLEDFDKLNDEATDIYKLYTSFESQSKLNADDFNQRKEKYKDLFAMLNGVNEMSAKNQIFFDIKKFELDANVVDIKMQGDNCVEGFQTTYRMFQFDDRNLKLCQCFNGEYATYFANKVAKDYLGVQFPNIEEFYQFESIYVAKQEENLNSLETSLKNLLKKYENAPAQEDVRSKVQTKDMLPSFNNSIIDLQLLTFHTQKLQLPQLTASSRALLDENHYTVTRSLKTRNAFLYSSPWAALSAFDFENSLKNSKLVVRALPSNKSHCSAVTDAGNQYVELYNSIRSISDSYSQTMNQLNLIHQSMEKETNSLKASKVGTSNETNTDVQYWVRQLERGTQYFSDLIKKKLSKYSATALNEFKSKFESALKRNGVQNIARFVRQLKGKLQKALTTKKTKGITAASKLSEAIVALFSKPNLKLNEVSNRIKDMEKYVSNINGMVRSCKI